MTHRTVMVLGAGGMAGSAIVRVLRDDTTHIVTPQRHLWDLTRQHRAEQCIRTAKPDAIVMAAGKVGGIGANTAHQAEFLYDNAAIAISVIEAARREGVQRLIYLGSSCAYPRDVEQPFSEDQLLTGAFEPTNSGYGLAKSLGAELCRHYSEAYGVDYCCLMPCNLYGPGDNYSQSGHVLAMLLRRFHEAVANGDDTVTIWGTGWPLREFMHVDDLAAAVALLLRQSQLPSILNVGSGDEVSIRELAGFCAKITGFFGTIRHDSRKPDGFRRKLVCSNKIRAMGWRPQIPLRQGIREVYQQQFASAGVT